MKIQTGISCKTISAWIIFIIVCLMTANSVPAAVITVRDAKGTIHHFEAAPQRVVSIVPSATEMIFEMGAQSAVVGITYHDWFLEGAMEKAIVGGFFQPSEKQILALKPDLVIVSDFHETLIKRLKVLGLKVFVTDTVSLEQSFETILTFGELFRKQEKARRIVNRNEHEIQLIQDKIAKAVIGPKKRVFRLMGRDVVMTPGNDSFQNDLIRKAGGIPPDFGRAGGVIQVTKEEWQEFNPQVVYGCGGDKETARAFFSQKGWNQVDAVKNGQIFYFPCELTCRAATHSGYFIQWLASVIYTDEFSDPEGDVLPVEITHSKPVAVDLPYVKSAAVHTSTIYDVDNKTLMVDFKKPQTILSTLEGRRENILSVGNHYSPPPTWGPIYKRGMERMQARILEANQKDAATTAFLITGADLDNLSVQTAEFKEMKVTALVTAGVLSNAMRMSKDEGLYYEPGTINIILMTNMKLSERAMNRAVISATEAKTAALEEMDIRSSYTPMIHGATGTGTDNILVVQGQGIPIDNSGGHTRMGELIAKAVHAGVRDAVLKQNHISEKRHIFQRLKERKITLLELISGVTCDCIKQKNIQNSELSGQLDHLLLEKEYSAFLESALALSDDYENGLIKDLSLYRGWCRSVANGIAGETIDAPQDYFTAQEIPLVLKMALNALVDGMVHRIEIQKLAAGE